MPTLASIQTGVVRRLGREDASDPLEKPWSSGFFKEPIIGPVFVTTTHVVGDQQADLKHHGGPDKAVLAYAAGHYPAWRTELNLPDMPFGAFGENFTIDGWNEDTVCVGDVFRIGGEVVVEVSQPREPCWKLARRWKIRDLPKRVIATSRSGWYFRVRRIGTVEAGMAVERLENPFPQWTIRAANRVMHFEKQNAEANASLAECPALSIDWRDALIAKT